MYEDVFSVMKPVILALHVFHYLRLELLLIVI